MRCHWSFSYNIRQRSLGETGVSMSKIIRLEDSRKSFLIALGTAALVGCSSATRLLPGTRLRSTTLTTPKMLANQARATNPPARMDTVDVPGPDPVTTTNQPALQSTYPESRMAGSARLLAFGSLISLQGPTGGSDWLPLPCHDRRKVGMLTMQTTVIPMTAIAVSPMAQWCLTRRHRAVKEKER